jgi:hypothetical protein
MRLKQIAACSILAWVSTAAPAATAPTPVEVESDPLHHPFQEYAAGGSCATQGDCAVLFPVSKASRLLILHASCELTLAIGGTVAKVTLSGPASNARASLPAFAYGTATGGNFGVDAATFLFIAKGETPRIDVYSAGAPVQDLDCTVSGYTL